MADESVQEKRKRLRAVFDEVSERVAKRPKWLRSAETREQLDKIDFSRIAAEMTKTVVAERDFRRFEREVAHLTLEQVEALQERWREAIRKYHLHLAPLLKDTTCPSD